MNYNVDQLLDALAREVPKLPADEQRQRLQEAAKVVLPPKRVAATRAPARAASE